KLTWRSPPRIRLRCLPCPEARAAPIGRRWGGPASWGAENRTPRGGRRAHSAGERGAMRRSARLLLSVVGVLAVAAPARAVNPQVAALQVALTAKRMYAGRVDGIAGSATTSAVRSLQRAAGLTIDGSAGAATRAALGSLGRHD